VKVTEREDGAVIVEFAIVFVLFMTLLWGLISYGAIFAVQQSLTHAAAEGARAAVNVPDPATAATRAEQVAADQLNWLDAAGVTVVASVTGCDYDAAIECVYVTTSYDWAGHAIVPSILDIATPDTLSSRAVVQHD
jgi:Flp pilus assembly protein TadG